MADDVTREHFRWLRQVAGDHDIPGEAFRLAFVLGEHFNRDTGEAWPSQATLSARTGLSDRSVRTLLDRLVDGGHLNIRPHRGPKAVNVYTANRKQASASRNGEPEDGFRFSDENRKFGVGEPEVSCTRTGSLLPTNYLEPLQNLKGREERKIWFRKNQASFRCHITTEQPAWRRWCDFLGWVPPIDSRFGWNFPAAEPPSAG